MLVNNCFQGLNKKLAPHLLQPNEAQILVNAEIDRGVIESTKDLTNINISANKYIYYFENTWLSSNNYRNYTEYNEVLYYTEEGQKPKKYSSGQESFIGIEPPNAAPTLTETTGSNIEKGYVYDYVYTYYNINDGTESKPSPSAELDLAGSGTVAIIIGNIKQPIDPQITHIKVYRLGGHLTDYSLVETLDINSLTWTSGVTSWTDDVSEINIEGDILTSWDNDTPPANLKYITKYLTMLFGAEGNTLYFTKPAYPNYWPNYIIFDDIITGIGPTANGLLIFTKYETYILVGTTPDNMYRYLLNGAYGCIEHNTIKYTNNTLLWMSEEGICASNGGEIIVLTKNKLGKLAITPINAEVYDEQYFLQHSNGIIVIDFRLKELGFNIREYSINSEYLHKSENKLYSYYNGYIYEWYTGNELQLQYKSPALTEGFISMLKQYKVVYISYKGDFTVNIYIDGNLVNSYTMSAQNIKTDEVKIPTDLQEGYYFEIECIGTGVIYEIEFKVAGRANGR